jgi:hypothetical protein
VDLEDIAARPVKPRDHDDRVADGDALQSLRRPRVQLEPGVGRALRSLPGRAAGRNRGPTMASVLEDHRFELGFLRPARLRA